MPKFATTTSYKTIFGINHTAKFKGICCPSPTPHKVPLFLYDLKSFGGKKGYTERMQRYWNIQEQSGRGGKNNS